MLLHSASRAGIRDNFLGWLSDIQQKCISEYLWGVACISVRSGVWDQFPGTPQLFFLVRATLQRAPQGKPESFATYLCCRAAEKVAFYGGQMKALRPLRFPYKLCPAISWYRQSNLGHSLRDLALWFIGLDIVRELYQQPLSADCVSLERNGDHLIIERMGINLFFVKTFLSTM